jgi:catechol 2,3-dioxygenase-like lactoylglutathione lyase family enzyme
MGQLRAFDHVGITVADLDAATEFFVGLGLEFEGRTFVEGEFIDTVCGIPNCRTEIVMLRPPGGGTAVELSSFVRPDHHPGSPTAMANELGLRSVAFEVDDIQATVDQLATSGYGLVGSVGRYENAWLMAYVRGPEGIIVALAERIDRCAVTAERRSPGSDRVTQASAAAASRRTGLTANSCTWRCEVWPCSTACGAVPAEGIA